MNNISITNNEPIINIIYGSLIKLPTPSSISFLWNIGFLLGITLTLQIISGIILSMNYVPSTEIAFSSVIHTIRDIDAGWAIRYTHINGASLFFLLIYAHISRGIYFNSPNNTPIVWTSGVVIFLVTIIAAFIGYVLPWGQISYWGATVITSILSSFPYIGESLIMWLWGDFSVSQPTLNRIFSLHFIVPLVVAVLALIHLILLHESGSSNPTGTPTNVDNSNFFPIFIINDILPITVILCAISTLISLSPEHLGDPENFNSASITTTPTHINPEWYFLFAYAILRSIPSNLGGVLAIAASILILLVIIINNTLISNNFNPNSNILFWGFLTTIIILTWLGGEPVNDVTSSLSQVFTLLYFYLAITIYP